MTPKLTRAALIASVEALAAEREGATQTIDTAVKENESFRAANALLKERLVAQDKIINDANAEIARLKSELAARKPGRIIRRKSWNKSWSLVSANGRLAARVPDGAIELYVLGSGDIPATDWEEVDVP